MAKSKSVEATKKLELVVKKPNKELLEFSDKVGELIGFNPIRDIFEIGNRVNAVAQLLAHPDVDAILEKLEGSPAGFVTDRAAKGGKYPAAIRAQAIQDCLAQGAKVVGNEINIIAGKGMLVKNYYRRMISELGHDNSPSHGCNYQMENWFSKETMKDRGQGTITFDCIIAGKWINKTTGEVEAFSHESQQTVKFGGQYDTIDKAQGQVQRRAWKEFFEKWSGVYTDDNETNFDNDAIEPKTEPTDINTSMPETKKASEPEIEDAEIIEPETTKITQEKETAVNSAAPESGTKTQEPQEQPTQTEEPPPAQNGDPGLLGPDEEDLF